MHRYAYRNICMFPCIYIQVHRNILNKYPNVQGTDIHKYMYTHLEKHKYSCSHMSMGADRHI